MDDLKRIAIERSIKERQDIVDKYRKFGEIDRDEAISKIRSLRLTDSRVRDMTAIELMIHPTPFEDATNDQIVGELQMQVLILSAELSEII